MDQSCDGGMRFQGGIQSMGFDTFGWFSSLGLFDACQSILSGSTLLVVSPLCFFCGYGRIFHQPDLHISNFMVVGPNSTPVILLISYA